MRRPSRARKRRAALRPCTVPPGVLYSSLQRPDYSMRRAFAKDIAVGLDRAGSFGHEAPSVTGPRSTLSFTVTPSTVQLSSVAGYADETWTRGPRSISVDSCSRRNHGPRCHTREQFSSRSPPGAVPDLDHFYTREWAISYAHRPAATAALCRLCGCFEATVPAHYLTLEFTLEVLYRR